MDWNIWHCNIALVTKLWSYDFIAFIFMPVILCGAVTWSTTHMRQLVESGCVQSMVLVSHESTTRSLVGLGLVCI